MKNTTPSSPASTVPAATVQAVVSANRHFRGKRGTKSAKAPLPDRRKLASGNWQQRKCFRCGCNKHLASDKNCPAATVNCSNCGNKGHFAKEVHRKCEVPQGNPRSLELIVDIGAAVSIPPEKIYRQHFADCPLTASQVKLVTYAKGDLPILGCLSAEVAIANQDVKVPALFYIVKAGSPLLGLDLMTAQ